MSQSCQRSTKKQYQKTHGLYLEFCGPSKARWFSVFKEKMGLGTYSYTYTSK